MAVTRRQKANQQQPPPPPPATKPKKPKKTKKAKPKTHLQHIQNYRESEDYRNNENKSKILRRVAKGSVPNVNSLAKYGITLKDINDLRKLYGFPEIDIHIPYFMKARNKQEQVNELDYLPDNDEVVGPFNDEEVEGNFDPNDGSDTRFTYDNPQANYQTGKPFGFSLPEVARFVIAHPGFVGAKTNEELAPSTVKTQFGHFERGVFSKTGGFHNFFIHQLSDKPEWYDDLRLATTPEAIEYIAQQTRKDHKNLKVDKGGNEISDRGTILTKMTTFLKSLRLYPGFDGLNRFKTNQRRYQIAYEQFNRQYVLIDAEIKAEQLSNPKEKKSVLEWNGLYQAILNKYPKGTKEHLYIRMYHEYPSRDDFKNLFIDDKSVPPATDTERDRVKKNTIFVNGNRAVIVLSNYKTVKIYGKSMFQFSKDVTDELKGYISVNGSSLKSKLLFGPSSMSQFVANILDTVGVPVDREGQINYLDEGPSHDMTQYYHALFHLEFGSRIHLVTARYAGGSFLNRVELLNGHQGFACNNVLIPSTLTGSNRPDGAAVCPDALKRNMLAAIEEYIQPMKSTYIPESKP